MSFVLPRYRSRLSKHPFSQTQWLAMLCRMRYQNETFRATAVRLREQGELRKLLRLRRLPEDTSRYCVLKRLGDQRIDPALGEAARRRGNTSRARRRAPVAVEATGLAPGAASTFLVRRIYHPRQRPSSPPPRANSRPALRAATGSWKKILRYETTIERQLCRSMDTLQRLQHRRGGEIAPPLINLKVSNEK